MARCSVRPKKSVLMNGSSSNRSRGVLLHPARGRTQLLPKWNAGELPVGVPTTRLIRGLLGRQRIQISRLRTASGGHATVC